MWQLLVEWLPTFGWIVGGALLIPGVMMGVYRVFTEICDPSLYQLFLILEKHRASKFLKPGSIAHSLWHQLFLIFEKQLSSKFLKPGSIAPFFSILPGMMCAGGLLAITGGGLWLWRVYADLAGRASIVRAILIGGCFGVIYAWGIHKLFKTNIRANISQRIFAAGALYSLAYMVVILIYQGPVFVYAAGAIWFVGVMVGMLVGREFVDDLDRAIARWLQGAMLVGISIFVIVWFISAVMHKSLTGKVWGEVAGSFGLKLLLFLLTGFFLYWILRWCTSRSTRLLLGLLSGIANWIVWRVTLLVIFARVKTIICNHCYRYTDPFQAIYTNGRRYCEHCAGQVDQTSDPGKVIVLLGDFKLYPEGRVFQLYYPDFDRTTYPMEVSEVYIDLKVCDARLITRFITYIAKYPPFQGSQSVKLFYRGDLDDLDASLKNALRNTFTQIEKIP